MKDAIAFKATLQLNNNFNPAGQVVQWDLAGIGGTVTLDAKGNSPKSTTTKVSLRYKKPKAGEAFTARPAKISISMKGLSLSTLKLAAIANLNADTPKTGSNGTAHLCVVLKDHQAFEVDKNGIYKAKLNKNGAFKAK